MFFMYNVRSFVENGLFYNESYFKFDSFINSHESNERIYILLLFK